MHRVVLYKILIQVYAVIHPALLHCSLRIAALFVCHSVVKLLIHAV
jgi:hypothetical protein